jgi:hypothetical protein
MSPVSHENILLREALQALHEISGLDGHVLPDHPNEGSQYQPDALIEIVAGEQRVPFVVEVKNHADRVQVLGHVKSQLEKAIQDGFLKYHPLLITPYITRQLAEECRKLNLPFIDTAGNAYINTAGIFLYVAGQPKPEHLERLPRTSTSAGLRVVFTLLCEPELTINTYRAIAQYTGVALGAIGPVLKSLQRREFLRSDPKRQHMVLQRASELFDEWLAQYPSMLRPKLHPRRYQVEPERLLQVDLVKHKAYWGGEVAAERLTGYLKPEHFTIYARGVIHPLLAEAYMRLSPTGNVEILDAFWPEQVTKENPALVPPLLVYTDLMMTGEARNVETAKLIYDRYIEPTLNPR